VGQLLKGALLVSGLTVCVAAPAFALCPGRGYIERGRIVTDVILEYGPDWEGQCNYTCMVVDVRYKYCMPPWDPPEEPIITPYAETENSYPIKIAPPDDDCPWVPVAGPQVCCNGDGFLDRHPDAWCSY
jgi:hypothetical protein